MNCAFGAALLGMALLPWNATPPDKSQSAKTKSTKASTTGKRATTRRSGSARYARRAPRPSYQLHPDPERYQQIQQALADRGYFKGAVNGQWGDDSVDALKRFQADQKLVNDGKISAPTLTGLGLGPKHDGSAAVGAAAPQGATSGDASKQPATTNEAAPATPPR
jgi:Putative peptidoglycan binding domain